MRARLPVWVVGVLLLLAAVVVRVEWEGRRHLRLGLTALENAELHKAQSHFLLSGRSYLPVSGTSDAAVRELLALGARHLEAGRFAESVSAFDDARGAIHSTRWLLSSRTGLRAEADEGYARSLAAWKGEGKVDESDVQRYRKLAEDFQPTHRGWSFLMGLSFLGYVGALGRLAWKWTDPRHRKLPWLGAGVACFAVWVLSMIFA
jgi:hypothetical protein